MNAARRCPNGHVVYKARGLTCMVRAGYYWCGQCLSEPSYRAMNGKPAQGMYYGPSRVTDAGTA